MLKSRWHSSLFPLSRHQDKKYCHRKHWNNFRGFSFGCNGMSVHSQQETKVQYLGCFERVPQKSACCFLSRGTRAELLMSYVAWWSNTITNDGQTLPFQKSLHTKIVKQQCQQMANPNLQMGLKQLSPVVFLSSLHSTEQFGRSLYTANQIIYFTVGMVIML